MSNQPILSVKDLKVHFPIPKARSWPWEAMPTLKAVDGVSFDLFEGETLGVVGESGCGKSTLARAIIGLAPTHSGEISWKGENIAGVSGNDLRVIRQDIQMIFRNYSATSD